MSDDQTWLSKLQVEVALVREVEFRRTRLFEKRASMLRDTYYQALESLQPEGNLAIRASGVAMRLTRGLHPDTSAWVKVEVCVLDEIGEPGAAVAALLLSSSLDVDALCQCDCPDLPTLSLDSFDQAAVQEMLFKFLLFGLQQAIARP